MLPVELSRTADRRQATLALRADAGLFWFSGHFPGRPLLPGVAQLDWVMHYGSQLLAKGWRFSALDSIKFQQPIPPDSLLWLSMSWDADRALLSFSLRLGPDEQSPIASSGKIRLCR